MNKWTWAVVAAAVLWALISWNWYVCGIKDLCNISENVEEVFINETDEVSERPDDVVRGGETRSTIQTTERTTSQRTVECTTYLLGSVDINRANNSSNVTLVEQFLNDIEGEELNVNGVYEEEDIMAVMRFQEKYREQILDPLGINEPTGRVLGSTRDQINSIYCAVTAR